MWSNALLAVVVFQTLTCALSHKHADRALAAADSQKRAVGYGGADTTTEADYFHFVTRPDIRALKWDIQLYDAKAVAPGYWFIAPYELLGQKERGAAWIGPYIYDATGELIWSGAPLFDSFNIFDFRAVQIHGENMLTAIYKREDAGVIVDDSYRIKKMVPWPGGYDAANMHEFSVFEDGAKAVVLTREVRHLSKEKSQEIGFNGECAINTNGLLELDIHGDSPQTLFNWSWIDHMSLDEITYPTRLDVDKECRNGWDANHCNAIDRFDNGDYLISCRHTDALYKISRRDGSVLWRLGGTKSDYVFVGEAKFSRQHHARVFESNETHTVITLFDNARGEGIQTATHDYTRGLILSLHDNLAEVVAEYPRPDHEYSTSRGSLEILPNGNVFMGWTFHSRISEHKADGTILMKAKLPPQKNTYRSYKAPWTGRPANPPDVLSRAVERGSSGKYTTQVHVSWNGATEVVKWHLHQTNAQGDKEKLVKSVAKGGFETSVKLDDYIHSVIVEAIDKDGRSLGQSKLVQTIPPDRDSEIFNAEQEWLEKNIPSTTSDHLHEAQGEPYGADTGTNLPALSSQAGSWDGTSLVGEHAKLTAYIGGFLTCSLVGMLCWVGFWLIHRLRRGPQTQGYLQVFKDDHENDHELDERVGESDGSRGRSTTSIDRDNGRVRKEG